MDIAGIVRRFGGLLGMGLVYFGLTDEGSFGTVLDGVVTAIGALLAAFDFGKSILSKIGGGDKAA